MYENHFLQSISSKEDWNNRMNYAKGDTNDRESMKNETFLNSWIYECSEELNSWLKSKEGRRRTTKKDKKIDETE